MKLPLIFAVYNNFVVPCVEEAIPGIYRGVHATQLIMFMFHGLFPVYGPFITQEKAEKNV